MVYLIDFHAVGFLQDLGQRADVVVVRMRREPCFHFVAECGDESPQEKRFVIHPAVHDDDAPFVRQKNERISDRVYLRRKLPEGKTRFAGSFSP